MTPHRPPRIFFIGGFFLCMNGGYVNVVAMYEPFHQGVSHLTGTLSRIGIDLVEPSGFLWEGLGLVISYLAGSALSGAILDSTNFQLGRRYGVMLILEAGILAMAGALIEHQQLSGLFFAAAACGLQNGMTTHYSSAAVRTTHMTGMVTDLGIFFGKWISRKPVDHWRLSLYLVALSGFVLGGWLGALSFAQWRQNAFNVCASVCALAGTAHWIWRVRWLRNQKRQSNKPI